MTKNLTYRERFQSLDGADTNLSHAHYMECARQYRSRWKSWLPADHGAAFLDLGCGFGEWLYFLREQGYTNAVGIDVSASRVESAKSVVLANIVKAEAKEFLIRSRDKFDVITAFNFFEHLSKDELLDVLELICGALRPNGRVLAVTPNGLSPFSGATRYWDFSHEQSFTPASWRQIAALTRFRKIHFEEYGPMAHSVAGAIRVWLWSGVRLVIKFINYVEVGGPRGDTRVYTADMKIVLMKND